MTTTVEMEKWLTIYKERLDEVHFHESEIHLYNASTNPNYRAATTCASIIDITEKVAKLLDEIHELLQNHIQTSQEMDGWYAKRQTGLTGNLCSCSS
jgi:hypothetical protein